MHAALFTAPHVTSLRAPLTGRRADAVLEEMGVRPLLNDLAMEGRLDAPSFAALWRRRRTSAPYLRALLKRCEARGHPRLAARVCRWGLRTADQAFFARRLAQMGDLARTAH